ncbi:hypothetical protein RB2654_14005 [Rhodobacterales bacterium HTCC2654]|uniref:Uncharacterized protein n=1 Tax=Maritimibacter alkaliphilus HTCC2654 TaxID=314271 RepID=A3VGK0_9RHOB|nr:hypothetical protein RB2654_14005 [Rhodobacterales bacterium HTCC2654] [Maritimibacter alkaliphilus HTCC2654]
MSSCARWQDRPAGNGGMSVFSCHSY